MIETGEPARCPVCRARFRGSTICSRCGADLEPLMTVMARAYHLRQLAARALQEGNYEHAERFAAQAQANCATPRGRDLERLGAWLARESIGHTSGIAQGDSTVTSENLAAPERTNLTPRCRERHFAVWCLIAVGIAGLGWAATAGALRWLRVSEGWQVFWR